MSYLAHPKRWIIIARKVLNTAANRTSIYHNDRGLAAIAHDDSIVHDNNCVDTAFYRYSVVYTVYRYNAVDTAVYHDDSVVYCVVELAIFLDWYLPPLNLSLAPQPAQSVECSTHFLPSP